MFDVEKMASYPIDSVGPISQGAYQSLKISEINVFNFKALTRLNFRLYFYLRSQKVLNKSLDKCHCHFLRKL